MICPDCGAEYREGITICADCSIPLITKSAYDQRVKMKEVEEAKQESAARIDLVPIHSVQGMMESDLIQAMLEASGIRNITRSTATASVHPFTMDGLGEITIVVSEEDAEEARRVIQEYTRSQEHTGDQENTEDQE